MDWTGSLSGHVCETLRDLHGVLCSQSARRRLPTGRAGVENPSDCEVCFCDAQGDVMAARVVGIRQEGVNPCRMVPSMRDEVHVQLHDVTGKVQSVRL